MIMKKYFILAAAVAMFTACTNNDDITQQSPTENERIPLKLGYSFSDLSAPTVTTRGNLIDLQDEAIMTGTTANTIGLFILKDDDGSGNTPYSRTDLSFEQWNIASSALTPTTPAAGYVQISTAENLMYPTKDKGINLFAYAPRITATSGAGSQLPATFTNISSDKILFYTQTDQTSDANFMASDVLWGNQGKIKNSSSNVVSGEKYAAAKSEVSTAGSSGALTTNAAYYGIYDATPANCEAVVIMPMAHKGCKIIVNVHTNGIEIEKLNNATVNFYVDHLQGELTVSDGTFSANTSELYTANTKVTLTSHLGIQNTVASVGDPITAEGQLDTNSDSNIDTYTCAAVIVPQTTTNTAANDGGKAVEIILKANNTSTAATSTTYIWKDTTARNFQSGKKYIYDITVKATGLQVTTTVADWGTDSWGTSGSPAGGDAVLQ